MQVSVPPNWKNYVYKDNLRYAIPYQIQQTLSFKPRWSNQALEQVFFHEFGIPHKLTHAALEKKHIMINNQIPLPTYLLQPHDAIQLERWVVERPIQAVEKIVLISQDEDLLVMEKPFGIPVHPKGRYYRNSLTHILSNETEYQFPSPMKLLHRLDRTVSGLLCFALHYKSSRKWNLLLQNNRMLKFYILLCRGEFPFESIHVDEPLIEVHARSAQFRTQNQISLYDIQRYNLEKLQDGSFINKETNTPCKILKAESKFFKLDYNQDTNVSLILAQPISGKTHQLREHMKYLQFPIIFDERSAEQSLFHEEVQDQRWNSKDWLYKQENISNEQIAQQLLKQQLELHSQELLHQKQFICLHAYQYLDKSSVNWKSKQLPIWIEQIGKFDAEVVRHKADLFIANVS